MLRVVSLVPSLTETAFGLGLGPEEIVGRTSFCVHPQPLVREIPVMGGTKTPRMRRILALAPDLILMDRDENRHQDAVELQRAGIELFVADLPGAAEVEPMLLQLGERLGRAASAREQVRRLREAREAAALARSARRRIRCLPLVWHRPLMTAAPDRYCGGLLGEAGFEVPRVGDARYPEVTIEQIATLGVDLLLLPSEPHKFTAEEGEKLRESVLAAGGRPVRIRLIDGEDLFWYGVRTAPALAGLTELARELQGEVA
jgi:ABC-type Fe3+-hydroxamate transport system substrate-binding protein